MDNIQVGESNRTPGAVTDGGLRRKLAYALAIPFVVQAIGFQAAVLGGYLNTEARECVPLGGPNSWRSACDYGFFGPYFGFQVVGWESVFAGLAVGLLASATVYGLHRRQGRQAVEEGVE